MNCGSFHGYSTTTTPPGGKSSGLERGQTGIDLVRRETEGFGFEIAPFAHGRSKAVSWVGFRQGFQLALGDRAR